MAQAGIKATTQDADPIFGLIKKHRATVDKVLANDEANNLPKAQALRLLDTFDRQAWALLDTPPTTKEGAIALACYAAEIHSTVDHGWPDGAPNSSRPDREWLKELRERLASAMVSLEGSVYDLSYMVDLAADAVNDAIGEDHSEHTKNPEYFWIPGAKRDATLFAINHLQDMIREFKEKYFAAYNGSDNASSQKPT